jgi:hypothetical protein
MTFQEAAIRIGDALQRGVPKVWDGHGSILEMKTAGFAHWKQMEWPGFFFQFLCEIHLAGFMKIPGPRFGRTGFDGLYNLPWDFKAHAMNTSSHKIIVNDSEAIKYAIGEYGEVGLVLALGKVAYNDEMRTFQKWHEVLKGGKSRYEMERIARGAWSRLRKVSFTLEQISFIRLTDATLVKCGSFQSDFRNSNGKPRRAKVLIDLEKLDEETVHFVDF